MKRRWPPAFWSRSKGFLRSLSPNIRVQIAISFLGGFYRNGLVAVWQPFVLHLGGQGAITLLGLLESLGGWGGLVSSAMQLLGGWLADRLGRRPLMILSSLFTALAMGFYTLAALLGLWPLLVPGVVLAGMGLVGRAASNSLTAESARQDQRGLAYSLPMFAYIAPGVVTSVIAGQVTGGTNYFPVVLACLVLEAVVLVVLVRFLRETLPREKRRSATRQRLNLSRTLSGARRFLRRLWRPVVALAGDSFCWGIALSLLFGFLKDGYHFSDAELGWINAFYSLSWALAQLPVGRLVDRHGCKRFLVVSEFLSIACLVMLLLWPTFVGVSLAYALLGFSAALWVPALLKLLAGSVAEKERGQAMGLVFTVQGLARFPGPILAATLYEWGGYPVPLLVGLGMACGVTVLIGVLLREPPAAPAEA
jgi:DHA1 family multidrug resistance protein-like MFS transporter